MRGCRKLLLGDVDRPLPIGSTAMTNQRRGDSAAFSPSKKSSW